jgi:prepilin-type N-terminal cleavage/methylation domain-containing protein
VARQQKLTEVVMKRRQGFTALELIIAMAILGLVLALASRGIIDSLDAKRSQETIVSAQEKARRIVQVISQDVRGSIFGTLVNTPYTSDTKNVSFLLLDGGAGYNVSGQTSDGYTISSQAATAADLGLNGGKVLVINQEGKAVLYSVSEVTGSGNTYTVKYSSCSSAIPLTGDTLMFRVSTVGYRYDNSSKTVFRQINNNAEEAVAFDIESGGNNQYDVDYIYEAADGSFQNQWEPVKSNGIPVTSYTSSGKTYTLARLSFGIGVAGSNINRNTTNRDISSTVELKDAVDNSRYSSRYRSITEGVKLCN